MKRLPLAVLGLLAVSLTSPGCASKPCGGPQLRLPQPPPFRFSGPTLPRPNQAVPQLAASLNGALDPQAARANVQNFGDGSQLVAGRRASMFQPAVGGSALPGPVVGTRPQSLTFSQGQPAADWPTPAIALQQATQTHQHQTAAGLSGTTTAENNAAVGRASFVTASLGQLAAAPKTAPPKTAPPKTAAQMRPAAETEAVNRDRWQAAGAEARRVASRPNVGQTAEQDAAVFPAATGPASNQRNSVATARAIGPSTPLVKQLAPGEDLVQFVRSAPGVVLIDFYADWCAPCQQQGQIIARVEQAGSAENASIVKVNIDQHPNLVNQFGVSSLPTLMLIKNGEVVERKTGIADQSQIFSFLAR